MSSLADRRSKKSKRTRRSKSKNGPAGNKWYALITNVVSGASGTSVGDINSCLPKDWQVADSTPEPAGNNKPDDKSTINTILDGVSTVIKFVCHFKNQIKDLFGKKMKLYNRKLFFQKMERYKKRWSVGGFFKSVGNAVKGAAKSVGNAVSGAYNKAKDFVSGVANRVTGAVNGAIADVKKGLQEIGDFAKKTWDQVKNFAAGVIDHIKKIFFYVKNKIEQLINSDLVKKIEFIVNCAEKAKATMMALYNTIKGIYTKITTVVGTGGVGLAKVFVDLICNFDIFRAAVNALIQAIGEKDTIKQYAGYGQFTGLLLKAIGSKRFRKMRRYNM